MLSMALARSWARKLDTYSWSFLSSLAKTLAVCRSMAYARRLRKLGHGPGRARPLRAEEERVAGWGCAALRYYRRSGDVSRQQEAPIEHIDVLSRRYARNS